MARACSGSWDAPSSVEPTRSANSTLATLRSSGWGAALSAAAHAWQKRASSGFSFPQVVQIGTDRVYDGPLAGSRTKLHPSVGSELQRKRARVCPRVDARPSLVFPSQ